MDRDIGEPAMLNRGHGTPFLRLQCARLFSQGAPAIGTDPHPDSRRAIWVYEKVGFGAVGGPVDTRWGRAILMESWPRSEASA